MFLPCHLLYHSKICKGITSFWGSSEGVHRCIADQRFRKWWRKTNVTDLKEDRTVSFYRSEFIGLGEGRVIHRLSVSWSTFWKEILLSTEDFLGYCFKVLILEWAYLHICIHSTAQLFPLYLNEKLPLSLKVTCGNPGPWKITQKTQCQD